jgi:hypothetical protein
VATISCVVLLQLIAAEWLRGRDKAYAVCSMHQGYNSVIYAVITLLILQPGTVRQ